MLVDQRESWYSIERVGTVERVGRVEEERMLIE